MIVRLRIRDMALIDEMELEFSPGLNVLTGETGAGKTVIVGALSLLMGGRADAGAIRGGAETLELEGLFELPLGMPLPSDDDLAGGGIAGDEREVLVRRLVTRDGRSRCSVNGRMTTVSGLATLMAGLVEIHGQHEHQRLLRSATHLGYLDRFGGAVHLERVQRMEESHRLWREASRRLDDARLAEEQRGQMLELAAYRLRELETAEEREGEYEELLASRRRLQNSELILGQLAEACRLLEGDEAGQVGAADAAATAAALLSRLAEMDPGVVEISRALDDAGARLRELAGTLAQRRDEMLYQPQDLELLERRLHLLGDLARKYGATYEERAAVLESSRETVEGVERGQADLAALVTAEAAARDAMNAEAEALSSLRAELAASLEGAVNRELDELNMGGIRFHLDLRAAPISSTGTDSAEFLIAAGPAEPMRPMIKIASGGELSRIMLSLKIVLAQADGVPVLVFDEIDAGIGGLTAGVIAEKLGRLAGYHQLFSVTHLPQIAARGERQFLVYKEGADERTVTRASVLEGEARLEEISRMLGGGGEEAREHARTLMRT
ncbi:MAG: DNA repair protein RecN [Candidatus Geothermincolia bacterium]